VEMARRLARRVGTELDIPTYLYEDAATRPERQNLENIRRGQYEGLKMDILTDPNRAPDFGPAELGPAGATVIGARQPLIAFNVYLTTDDVSIAQKIARSVRNSSGGLRFVKGMGVLVEGRAQVSMNLTNYRQTPIARVVEMVRREAQRYGVAVHHTELVGLIPQEALVDAAVWYTQMDQFEPHQLLEQRLYSALAETTPATAAPIAEPSFIDRLAAGTPTPGGGSASAHTGAAAAGLVAMVARLTVGKKKYAAVEAHMWAIIEEADRLRIELVQAVEEDSAAFEAFMAANKLPKETDEQQAVRAEAQQKATLYAAQVPLGAAMRAARVCELATQVAALGNLNAISDAGSASALARAALTGAAMNVRINLAGLSQPELGQPLLTELAQAEERLRTAEKQVEQALLERSNLPYCQL
jgi:glutamate formiminotransferase/formiminotetrahydrofolate cyclodeaminase